MIEAKYQAWNDGVLVHPYKTFDREKALIMGEDRAVARYDDVLALFMKLSADKRKKGIIYGGAEYDFSLQEVR
jgi:hypothetical protein